MRFKKLVFLVFIIVSKYSFAGWVDLGTGIVDDLNGVVFSGSTGVVAGNKGIYYTTTGGSGAASWTRYTITSSPGDAAIYNGSQFYSIASYFANELYFCGKDTINNRAIVFYLNPTTLAYSIIYLGTPGSKLNSIGLGNSGTIAYSVGDNGLVVRSVPSSSTNTIVSLGTTQTLNKVKVSGTRIIISGDGVLLNCTDSGTLTGALNLYPGMNIKSAFAYNTSANIYAVGSTVYKYNVSGSSYAPMNSYDYGPLNANDIYYTSTGYYIVTDHGIYKTDPAINFAEFQVTSSSYNISAIWFATPTVGYATGKNGLVLKTTDAGNPVKPYATMGLLTINCVGSFSTLYGSPGTATSCNWKLDGTLISSACVGFSYIFTVPGTYTLSYIVWNSGGIYDTVSQTIQIDNPPLINLPVSIDDSIICKKEIVDIIIDSTQVGFFYRLKKFGGTPSYGSVLGNGSTVNLISDSLTQGGNYYIYVESAFSQCGKAFTDTIKITSEHTKAEFHSSLINANLGENVNFYERTIDAQNFIWTISPGASISTSTLPDIPGVTFGSLGGTTVKLICWSNNGCYDSIQRPGPFIYQEPVVEDTCWAQAINSTTPPYMGVSSEPEAIVASCPTRDGYLMSGRTYKDLFTSRLGTTTYGRALTHGAILLKYSRSGVLKWLLTTNKIAIPGSWIGYAEPGINCVYADKNENIFIAGNGTQTPFLHTSDSDSVRIFPGTPGTSYTVGHITKLDSLGNYIWGLSITQCSPQDIKTDRSGNIYVTGKFNGSFPVIDNGIDTTHIPNPGGASSFLMKLSPTGDLLWKARLEIAGTWKGIEEFDIDAQNSVYLTGDCGATSHFRSAISSTDIVNTAPSIEGKRVFVVKYDSLGEVIWAVKAFSYNRPNGTTTGKSIAADSAGNTYISGRTYIHDVSYSFKFTDAAGVDSYHNIGTYFLMKVSPVGTLKWVIGSELITCDVGQPAYMTFDYKNKITVSGQLKSNSYPMSWAGNLLSTNGSNIYLVNPAYEIFIAEYDTAGVIKRVSLTGTSSVYVGSEPTGIFRDSNDMVYITGNTAYASAPYAIFGDLITPNGYIDSYVAKMGLYGCGTGLITAEEEMEASSENDFRIYPNPAHSDLYIDLKNLKSVHIRIHNAFGQLVYEEENVSGVVKINKKEFTSSVGIYFVEITSQTFRKTQKIIIN